MKFCCRRCGSLYHKKHPLTDQKPKDGICDICELPYVRVKGNQRYCSRTCYENAWQKNNRDHYNANASANGKRRRAEARMAPIQCSQCGNNFQSNHLSQKMCSIECRRAKNIADGIEMRPVWQKTAYQRTRKRSPWMHLVHAARSRSKKKRIPCDIDSDWAEKAYDGKCQLTGISFVIGDDRSPLSPSIDRIIPGIGYVKGNCRFILWALNAFKGESTDDQMFSIAEAMMNFRSAGGAPVRINPPAGASGHAVPVAKVIEQLKIHS